MHACFVDEEDYTDLSFLLYQGKTEENPYEPVLDENEREAVSDLLEFLEHVSIVHLHLCICARYDSLLTEHAARRCRL